MSTIQLSLERTKELLADAVALKGADHVYTTPDGQRGDPDDQPRCFYVHGDEPGCIVGHVLHRAGVSLARLRAEESNDASGVLRNLGADDSQALEYDRGVSTLLLEVQEQQDSGISWGTAVDQALSGLAA